MIRVLVLVAVTAAVPAAFGVDSAVFTHDDWNEVLSRFVDENGRVDYAALARDRDALDSYLAAIAEAGPRSTPDRFPTRDHELAFYINAYNALVFAGVLNLGEDAETVWGGLLRGFSFFVKHKYRIDGQWINLRNLENKLIREQYGDARIHAALNCASTGCPRRPAMALEPGELDRSLDASMAEFATDERNVRIKTETRTVYLSKIFEWFRGDFVADEREAGNPDPTLIDYINRFRGDAPPVPRNFKIRFLEYDRSLYGAPATVSR